MEPRRPGRERARPGLTSITDAAAAWAATPWGDRSLAVLMAASVVLLTSVAPAGRTDPDTAGYLLVIVASSALAFRRRAPVAVLLVSAASVVVYQALGYPGVAAGLPLLVALYTAVRSGHRALAAVVTAVALAKGTVATMMVSAPGESVRDVLESRVLLAGCLTAGAVLGEVARKKEAYLHEVECRAVEAERTREEMALRRAGEERLRIARDLHDSLTHSISVVKVQAGVAIHLARKRGEVVPDALLAIEEAGTDAIRELRATLHVLRSDDASEPTSLDRLPDLVAGARQAGVPATVTVTGEPQAVPSDVDRAAYRIIQEALTNVTRHAGPAEASIRLGFRPEELTVQVDDNGCASPDARPAPGMGLRGMHERVAALGGHLATGPRDRGGFSVRARLPLPAGPPAEAR